MKQRAVQVYARGEHREALQHSPLLFSSSRVCLGRASDLCGHKMRRDILGSMNHKHTKRKGAKWFGRVFKLDEIVGDSDIFESNAEGRK
jgi:hypothetical protein